MKKKSQKSKRLHARMTAIESFGGALSSVRVDDLIAELFKDYVKIAQHD